MAPIMAQLVPYTALYDTSLSLVDWARMNDALYVRSHNEAQMRKAQAHD